MPSYVNRLKGSKSVVESALMFMSGGGYRLTRHKKTIDSSVSASSAFPEAMLRICPGYRFLADRTHSLSSNFFTSFPSSGIFIALSPFVKPFFRFVLQLFTQYLVNLQAVAQRLPVTINT